MKLWNSFLIQLKIDIKINWNQWKVVFDYVQLLYYKFHKINPNQVGPYIDCADWIKNKKATINPINKKDNKCFQYAVIFALSCKEITKKPWKNNTN